MIDSHCHLDHEPLVQNIEDVLAKCKKEGVQKLLTISTTLNGFPKILEIINKDEMIFGTFGIHPHETNNDQVSKNEIIKKINTNSKIIGVGETGLDFYYNNSDKDKQIRSFKNHIDAALELDIPLLVYSSYTDFGDAGFKTNSNGKQIFDMARDGQHSGVYSNKVFANKVAEDLKQKFDK